jgi:hypothetical protein
MRYLPKALSLLALISFYGSSKFSHGPQANSPSKKSEGVLGGNVNFCSTESIGLGKGECSAKLSPNSLGDHVYKKNEKSSQISFTDLSTFSLIYSTAGFVALIYYPFNYAFNNIPFRRLLPTEILLTGIVAAAASDAPSTVPKHFISKDFTSSINFAKLTTSTCFNSSALK